MLKNCLINAFHICPSHFDANKLIFVIIPSFRILTSGDLSFCASKKLPSLKILTLGDLPFCVSKKDLHEI